MRVRMLEQMPVTVDGVNTVDAEPGDELLMGDGVAADLIEAGKAEPVDAAADAPKPKRRGKKADAGGIKDAGAADENKDAGDDEPSDDGESAK